MLIDNKMYVSRLGEQVRVTSMGEFSGWSTDPDPVIDSRFRKEAASHVPGLKQDVD